MGRGLAFQKKVGETFDSQKVEKTFILETQVFLKSLQDYKGYSELYLNIASKIMDYAQSQLPYKLDEYLYVVLTDHLSFAISRYKKGFI